jgi:hypothetical protein
MNAGVKARIASKLTLPGVLSVLPPPVVGLMRRCNDCERVNPSAEHGAASAGFA